MARSKAASKKQQKQQQKRGVDFKVSFMSTYHFYFQFCFCYSLSKADKLSIYLFKKKIVENKTKAWQKVAASEKCYQY